MGCACGRAARGERNRPPRRRPARSCEARRLWQAPPRPFRAASASASRWRALAVEPRVLFLDEPFGALDAKVRRDLRRWLRGVHDRTGHATLFVTHDQE